MAVLNQLLAGLRSQSARLLPGLHVTALSLTPQPPCQPRPAGNLQIANARRIAEWLAAHPLVHRVNYPGLASHPGRDVHERQVRGLAGLDLEGTCKCAHPVHVA